MNKTFPLLDVTRTYQVTRSPFELFGDTAVQEPVCRMKQKKDEVSAVYLQPLRQGEVTAET